MAIVPKRVPPPPPFAVNDPIFNHWLHDLTAFLSKDGGIDTGTIPGYDALAATVADHTVTLATHTSQIATNTANIATHTSQIATHTSQITANNNAIATNIAGIATNTSNIATLAARSQVLHGIAAPSVGLGIDGDWYADTVAKHQYVKVSGAWVLIV